MAEKTRTTSKAGRARSSGTNGGNGAKATTTTKKARVAGASNGKNGTNGHTTATKRQLFQPVVAPTRVDYPLLEEGVQRWWDEHDILNKYLHRNDGAEKRWSFIDGPITANNPMGVHHAWGRTYKDLYLRYRAMQGYEQRYQNGFDCQGLWVEVEVEKELGFNSKREIEAYGLANFADRCRERVYRYADLITQQSIRLGQWMDWDNSYYTLSDENIETIWTFLRRCHENG